MKNINDYSWLEERILRHTERRTSPPATTGRLPTALTGTPMKNFTPESRPVQQNSILKLEALVPVRVATSRVLEGNWSGHELDEVRVVGSLFGGPHYILQLGYNQTVGHAASFRLVFVAHMPVEKGVVLTDPAVIEDARRTAEAFMMMLNLRRVPGLMATQVSSNIPGKPLTGKRADLLILDEVSANHPLIKNKLADARSPHAIDNLPEDPSKPYVEKLDDTLPGKRPV